jgi:hypothetical protein
MWVWRDGAWAWRPGFWFTNYAGWVYVPPSYFWTPHGWVYNPGYWDYTLDDRGLLFAPVCFPGNFVGAYTPTCVVGIGGLLDNLWFGPGCYWFGNCYGPFWRACGFRPWCLNGGRFGDGLWAHQAWANRGNANFAANAHSNFLARQNGQVAGPATTFNSRNVSNQVASSGGGVGQAAGGNLVTPLHQLSNRNSLTRASTAQLNQAQQSAQTLRQASATRGWNEGTQASYRGSGNGNTMRMPNQLVSNSGTMNGLHAQQGLTTGSGAYWNGHPNGNPATHAASAAAGYGPRVGSISRGPSGASYGGHTGGGGGGHMGGGGHGGGHR